MLDFKKTLQHELKSSNSSNNVLKDNNGLLNNRNEIMDLESLVGADQNTTTNSTSGASSLSVTVSNERTPIIMDEVNFKYLKHVILKFLTSREVNSIFILFIS